MNIRELKLALTVDLMNMPRSFTSIDSVQDSMSQFLDETGSFKGCEETVSTKIGAGIERKTLALQFEKVTLDLELFTNEYSREQYIKGFDLKENFA
ncbi:MAG: hypothetical protein K9J37_01705 [Saprospiraceae bacterium]|nr:hypothetical protein [Saprospiraceae bacterium]MCF8248592.1 hypothetical protein [Saprospiraceae bacterium]MCF8281030.1 hypothetical protein [Bacteroidales bacterium]MCF8310325.1 hypothetical protein [Saprospiraceae bacterium]MCF8443130.1 hypothetical protein [Saprospiraceae bacterium]